jgi:hypothetical protein
MIQFFHSVKRAGDLIKQWKTLLLEDDSYQVPTEAQTVVGSKRKAVRWFLVVGPLRSLTMPMLIIYYICQDVSVDEAEIRSKWEEGQLNKVCSASMRMLLWRIY